MEEEISYRTNPAQEKSRETKRFLRNIPQNELDFQMRTVETVWGSKSISPALEHITKKKTFYKDEDGKVWADVQDLFASLDIFNQDFRLGNLSME